MNAITIHTETADADWTHAVERCDGARLAHAAAWRAIVARAYGHTPLYLAADDGERVVGGLPAFVVRRPLVGTVVTSMPFLDSGGPCGESTVIRDMLVDRLLQLASAHGARFVELRCHVPQMLEAPPLESKVNMTLRLASADVLWRRFDKTVRNQIRKAERAGLSVERAGAADLALFYDAFAERMRDLGSPVHAIGFLRHVCDTFGPSARLMLVRQGRTTVGGLLAIAFKDRLVVPWSTCRKEFFALCPNMLLYWEAIRSAAADGLQQFDFGRSTRDSGTYRFKRQWGAEEEPLFWYRIPIGGRTVSHAGESSRGGDLACRVWQRLPLAVTRQLGPRIRKYLIQ